MQTELSHFTRPASRWFLPVLMAALFAWGGPADLSAAQKEDDALFKKMAEQVGQPEEFWELTTIFSPEKLPGLRLWLRADTGVTKDADGNVDKWSDPERGVTLKPAKPELRPRFSPAAQNGRPAIEMVSRAGEPASLTIPAFAHKGESISFIVVARLNQGAKPTQFLWYQKGYGKDGFFLATGMGTPGKITVTGNYGEGTAKGDPLPGRGFLVLQIDYDLASKRRAVYENGELLGDCPQTNAPAQTAPLEICGIPGAVAEVMVLATPPDLMTRTVLTHYLLKKYNLGGKAITPLASQLPFAYYPSSSEIEVAFDKDSPLLREYFAASGRKEADVRTEPGAAYAYYTTIPSPNEGGGVGNEINKNLEKYQPTEKGVMPSVTYSPSSKWPQWTRNAQFANALVIKGYIDAPETGTYTFSVPWGIARLYVADKLVVEIGDFNNAWPRFYDSGGAIALSKGKHPFYFIARVVQVLADAPAEQIFWTPPGEWSLKPVPIERFSHDPSDLSWKEPKPGLSGDVAAAVPTDLKSVDVGVMSLANGKAIESFTLPLDGGGRGQARFKLPELEDGTYAVDWLVAGKKVRATRTFQRKHFPWEKNTLGMEHTVFPPFKEIKVSGKKVEVVDRVYTMNGFGCFDSMVAKGREILAAPIQLVAEDENGKRVVWKEVQVSGKALYPDLAKFECSARSELGTLTSQIAIEEDGCAKIIWNLTPAEKPATIKRLWLEVPYRDAEVPLMGVENGANASWNFGKTPRGGKIKWKFTHWGPARWEAEPGPENGVFWTSLDSANFGGPLPFNLYVWLGGIERGLCWFASPQPDIRSDGVEPLQELDRQGDRVILRAYFIKQPTQLSAPLRYIFGLQGTPSKPCPADARTLTDIPDPNGVVPLGGYMCSSKYPDNADFSFIDRITEPARKGVKPDAAMKQAVRDWYKKRIWKDQTINYSHIIDDKLIEDGIDRLLSPGWNIVSYFEEHGTFPRQPDWQVFMDEWSTKEFERYQPALNWRYSGALSYNDFAVYYANEYLRRGVSLYFDNGGMRRYRSNPYLLGPDGNANALWEQREYYKRIWKRITALNRSGETFRPVYFVGNAQMNVPHLTWFTSFFGKETENAVDTNRPSRSNELTNMAISKGKGFRMPLSRGFIQAGLSLRSAGSVTLWGAPFSAMLLTSPAAAITENGMSLVHELTRPYKKDGVVWRSTPSYNQYGMRLADYFTWFGYGRPDVAVHNYWEDKPFLSISDPDVAWLAMTKNDKPSGMLLLQSYKDDAVTVAVGFPHNAAMMDMFTREVFVADKDGKVAIPLAADYGTRLLAVGKDRAALPPAPEPDDVVLGDFELGMPGDLDFLYHQAGLECSIVEDAGKPGNHVLRLKRPMFLALGSKARMMTDGVISFRFRLPSLPEKTGAGRVISYTWRESAPYPKTTHYEGVLLVGRAADGKTTWQVGKPRVVVEGKAQMFADIGADLTDKPLPGITVDTNWHTLSIETRGARHVIRFDDQTVFEGTSNLVPAGGFSLTPGYDPYIEIDDLRIRRK